MHATIVGTAHTVQRCYELNRCDSTFESMGYDWIETDSVIDYLVMSLCHVEKQKTAHCGREGYQ